MNGIQAREINDRKLNDLKMALFATTEHPTVSQSDIAKELVDVYGKDVASIFQRCAEILTGEDKKDDQDLLIEGYTSKTNDFRSGGRCSVCKKVTPKVRKVFREDTWFRGEDEYLGKVCEERDCTKTFSLKHKVNYRVY
jgi:hypothetical protein